MKYWDGLVYNFYSNRTLFLKDKEAVYDYDRKLHFTYGDLEERSQYVAGYLINTLGVK